MKSLLKFITCGSVDDGKSTLIGHMLYDAKLLFADQEQSLQLDSKVGSAGGEIDYSLLLDGLLAEREQGITIDVAYRYFTTDNRSFIVADTPGHEEYTRNMAVGASFADAAVILLDATKGVLSQTRRHTRICSLMGIRDFLFAVNKMDLVGYEQDTFVSIQKEILAMMEAFPHNSLQIIPVSAKCGDMINARSENLSWYPGEALLTCLEQLEPYQAADDTAFCMPVQRVCRPNYQFRGFQGQIQSGEIHTGDEITVLPSRETAHVRSILVTDCSVDAAGKGQPVTIELDREIDVSRGCVLVNKDLRSVSSRLQATILWMDDSELREGKSYFLKIGTRTVPATVQKIDCKIDINTGEQLPADRLVKNEIAVCTIAAAESLVMDVFAHSRELGGLILIDRVTNQTSACGTVSQVLHNSDRVVWHDMDITREVRANQLGQHPRTLWLTGLSGSGKSTLANELEKRLAAQGRHTMLLDGDNIRMGLNQNLGFSESDRTENIRRIAEVAKLMNDAGLIVLTSFISPFRRDRDNARAIIGEDFIEIYVATSLEECEKRDVKGLYQQARDGKIADFTGISSPYEIPEHPEITIQTEGRSVEETVDELMEKMETLLDESSR
jgi:bifunctional enzyme CysN/CysC